MKATASEPKEDNLANDNEDQDKGFESMETNETKIEASGTFPKIVIICVTATTKLRLLMVNWQAVK